MLSVALKLVLFGLAVSMVWMLILWLAQRRTRNGAWIEMGWSISIFLYVTQYFRLTGGLHPVEALILTVVALWALRLSAHLFFTQIASGIESPRYQELRKRWGEREDLRFLFLYEAHAFLNALLSVPFLLVALSVEEGQDALVMIGVALALVGTVGEAVADRQLARFEREPANAGRVCRAGLWKLSRHPNYFFEFVVWLGYGVIALGFPYGAAGLVAPAIMLFFLLRGSRMPWAEKETCDIKGEEFERYQKEVSAFIPWFPKKAK